ncbi:phage tail tape measure protein [Niallia sp. 01092]|uniref:phage tail tape measure protein n=1 Tax=unclassified Niallia TaxID=2837522 RepID=UPI003FD3AB93
MARAFTVAFNITGNMASSLTNAFSSTSRRLEGLKRDATDLKTSLRNLDREYRQGNIGLQEYTRAQQRLHSQLSRNIAQQERLQAIQSRQQNIKTAVSSTASEKFQQVKSAVAIPAAAIGLAGGATAVSSVKKAMDFESQLSSIQALTGMSDKELGSIKQLSLDVGSSTKYSALESAQGVEELSKSGMSTDTIKSGGLESALNLATAGGMELKDAAELMSNSLNGFKKDGMSAADASNILAGAANASSADLIDLKFGLASVGPVADGLNLSFKGTNAALAAFSNNNLQGSDAGTSLKTFLSNIQPSTEKARTAFDQLGLTLKDGQNIFFKNGKLKDMAEVAGILHEKFKKLSDQERSATFFDLFGSDAVRAANILYKEGADGIEKMYKEMSKVTALEVAKKKMDNAAGAVEQLSGAFETLQIIGAESALPLVKNAATALADSFGEHTDDVKRFGENLSKGLGDVFEPFITVKPKLDVKDGTTNELALADYQEKLAKYTKFKNMDFSEKVTYSLDTAVDAMEKWLDGPGGEAVNTIFTKLAEIAVKAWGAALKASLTGAIEQAMDGNVASAIGLGVAANALTGGLLLKGAGTLAKGIGLSMLVKSLTGGLTAAAGTRGLARGASRGGIVGAVVRPVARGLAVRGLTRGVTAGASAVYNRVRGRASSVNSNVTTRSGRYGTTNTRTSNTNIQTRSARYSTVNNSSNARLASTQVTNNTTRASRSISNQGSRTLGVLGKAGKVLSKAALPLTLATEAFSIYKAKDKVKATAESAGGLSASWGGASAGAAIGTAIFPGVGTAIGGLLGGLGGYIAGKWAAGKAVDAVRGSSEQPTSIPANQPISQLQTNTTATNVADGSINTINENAAQLAAVMAQAPEWIMPLANIGAISENIVENASLLADMFAQAPEYVSGFGNIDALTDNIVENASILAGVMAQAPSYVAGLGNLGAITDSLVMSAAQLAAVMAQAPSYVASLGNIGAIADNIVVNASLLSAYMSQAPSWILPLANLGAISESTVASAALLAGYMSQSPGWIVPLAGVQITASSIITNGSLLSGMLLMSAVAVASFSMVQSTASSISGNGSLLSSMLVAAASWVSSLNGIQTGAAAVKSALNTLASRINSAKVPSISATSPGGKSAQVHMHAQGGIFDQPHIGMVAEAGYAESIIPIIPGNKRSLALYQQTGEMLGISTNIESKEKSGSKLQSIPSFTAGKTAKIQMHAKGGIFDQPHLGMVAEAGYAESIIPIRPGDRRSLALYQQTGELLGLGQKTFNQENNRTQLLRRERNRIELFDRSQQLSQQLNNSQQSFVYAPVIHASNSSREEIHQVLAEDKPRFEEQMRQYESQRRRKSFR